MKILNSNPACPLPPETSNPIATLALHRDARIGLTMDLLFYRVEEFPKTTNRSIIVPNNPPSPIKVVVYVRSVFAKPEHELTLIGEYDRDFVATLDADALIAPVLAGFRKMWGGYPMNFAFLQAKCAEALA